MMSRRPLVALVAVLMLTGCGAPLAPTARVQNAKGLAAKGDLDDVIARIQTEAKAAVGRTGFHGGIAAVLDAPTDSYAQRGIKVWYERGAADVQREIVPTFDERLGELATAEMLQERPEVTNQVVRDYVQKVTDRLTAAAKQEKFKAFVIKDDTVNASNSGGHFLVVHSALIANVADEAELAGVLAHEITHGLRRHSMSSVSRYFLDQEAVGYVDGVFNVTPEELAHVNGHFKIFAPDMRWDGDKDLVLGFLKGKVRNEVMTAMVYRYNGWFANRDMGRDQELEADAGAVRMLAAAGYDPSAFGRVVDRWNDHLVADIRYSGHPSAGDRLGHARMVINRDQLKGTDTGADRLAAIKPLLAGAAPASTESLKASRVKSTRFSLGGNPWLRPAKK